MSTENKKDQTTQGKTRTMKAEYDDVLNRIEKDQVEKETLDQEKVSDTIDDTAKDFSEVKSTYAPETKAEPEVSKTTRSKRFSKEHEPLGKKPLKDEVHGETDRPSDENA